MAVLQTCDLAPQAVINRSSVLFDDFYQYATTQNGLTTAPTTGTSALETGNDRLLITTGGTDNNAQGVQTTQAAFSYTSGQAHYAESYIQFSNQSGNNANISFGFASSATLGISNGAAPTVACSALICKLDGKAVWTAVTSCNSVVTATDSLNVATDGKYLLDISIFNWDNLNAAVSFMVNGQQLRDSTGLPIIHKVPYASAAAMYGVVQAAAGSGNAQTLYVDYVTWGKNRLMTFNN